MHDGVTPIATGDRRAGADAGTRGREGPAFGYAPGGDVVVPRTPPGVPLRVRVEKLRQRCIEVSASHAIPPHAHSHLHPHPQDLGEDAFGHLYRHMVQRQQAHSGNALEHEEVMRVEVARVLRRRTTDMRVREVQRHMAELLLAENQYFGT